MKISHDIPQWALEDIKRLVAEATIGDDGRMPVVRDATWPEWIGAARSHLQMVVESAEARK
jgi:hypothetical protein